MKLTAALFLAATSVSLVTARPWARTTATSVLLRRDAQPGFVEINKLGNDDLTKRTARPGFVEINKPSTDDLTKRTAGPGFVEINTVGSPDMAKRATTLDPLAIDTLRELEHNGGDGSVGIGSRSDPDYIPDAVIG